MFATGKVTTEHRTCAGDGFVLVELIRKTPYKSTALPKKLSKILEEGIVGIDNCFFFRCFYEANSHINQRDFEDNTSYENFINEFHLDDYCRKGTLNYRMFLYL